MVALIVVAVLVIVLGVPIALLLFVQKQVEKTPLYRAIQNVAEKKGVEQK